MYKCLTKWRDLADNHLYAEGDEYPHDGREIPEKRIAELTSRQNKAGFALIQAVETQNEEIPVQEAKAAKKAVRSRKRTS